MASVFLARKRLAGGLDRWLAVKILHPFLDESDKRLLFDEARVAMAIRHPNVVPTFEVIDDESGACLVMEYVEGDTLLGLLRHKKDAEGLPGPIALRILADALAGLHAAHELVDHGVRVEVVHRDFTPSNVLVGIDGVSRLTDFGVAKATNCESRTRTGDIKGKIGYLSPEQIEERPVDRRSDIFAAGVVAWEALSGKRLHGGAESVGVMMRIVNEDAPRLRSVRPDLPQKLDDVVAWALERNVERRCPDADTFRRALLDAAAPLGGPADITDVARSVAARTAERRARIHEAIAALSAVEEGDESAPQNGGVPGAPPSAPASSLLGAPPTTSERAPTVATSADTRPPSRGARRAVGGALAAALLAGAYALIRFGHIPPVADAPLVASASAAGTAESRPASSASSPTTAAPSVAPIAPVAAVLVRASFPMVSVRVGAREVVFPSPSQEAEINLTEAERGSDIVVVARGVDGRTGTAKVSPQTRSVEIQGASTLQRPRRVKPADDTLAPPPHFKR